MCDIAQTKKTIIRLVLLGCTPWLGACDRSATQTSIEGQRLAVSVEDVVRLPDSDGKIARVNYLAPSPDGTQRLFVVDMNGLIHVLRNGRLLSEPFLDLRVARSGRFVSSRPLEQGLSTLAFHPDFAKVGSPGFGAVYTFSTEVPESGEPTFQVRAGPAKPTHHDVVIEWRVDSRDPNKVDPRSARELLRIAHPLRDHVGGQLAFNPTVAPGDPDHGKLYVAVGDGGNTVLLNNQVDDWRTAQNMGLPLGKVLRIDPLRQGDKPYGIPPDNPFLGDAKVLPEIWAYGLRNPQRFSWDTGATHKMLIADIGQAQLEEINVGKAGANYGWSEREGVRTVSHGAQDERLGLPLNDLLRGYTYPAIAYGHHIGRAITGGFVYRGKAMPELLGMYFFGDLVNGKVFVADVGTLESGAQVPFFELPLVYRGQRRTLLQIVNAPRADLRFGVDAASEIYLLTKTDGMVRRFGATVPTDSGLWPVDSALDPLGEESLWAAFVGRVQGTIRSMLDSRRRQP